MSKSRILLKQEKAKIGDLYIARVKERTGFSETVYSNAGITQEQLYVDTHKVSFGVKVEE